MPPNRTKVRKLFPLGETVPGKGVQAAPVWTRREDLYNLLSKTLVSGDIQHLLQHVRAHQGPRDPDDTHLNGRHADMTSAARDKLARWLRGLHVI